MSWKEMRLPDDGPRSGRGRKDAAGADGATAEAADAWSRKAVDKNND